MVDLAISQLTGAGALDGTEKIPILQAGFTVETTVIDVYNLAIVTLNLGTMTTGTLTPVPTDGKLQTYTNNGAHTLAPGAIAGFYYLDIINGASAGAITTSGWTKVKGDSFTTTNGHKFRCYASLGDAGTLLFVNAMQ